MVRFPPPKVFRTNSFHFFIGGSALLLNILNTQNKSVRCHSSQFNHKTDLLRSTKAQDRIFLFLHRNQIFMVIDKNGHFWTKKVDSTRHVKKKVKKIFHSLLCINKNVTKILQEQSESIFFSKMLSSIQIFHRGYEDKKQYVFVFSVVLEPFFCPLLSITIKI